MWQLLYSSIATYLCAKLLPSVDLMSRGSKNVSPGSGLKKITSDFLRQNSGKTLSVPSSFAFSGLSGDSGFGSPPPGYKMGKGLYARSGWKSFA